MWEGDGSIFIPPPPSLGLSRSAIPTLSTYRRVTLKRGPRRAQERARRGAQAAGPGGP
jgi:hypothetical protein